MRVGLRFVLYERGKVLKELLIIKMLTLALNKNWLTMRHNLQKIYQKYLVKCGILILLKGPYHYPKKLICVSHDNSEHWGKC